MADGVAVPGRTERDERAAGRVSLRAFARPGIVLLFVVVAWLGLRPLWAVPDVVPATAPAAVFSAERALADLRVLAAAPRPVGSAANNAARDYLLDRIAALGLEPQVQSTAVLRHQPGFPETHLMPVENVLVRVPGSEPGGKALLVSGHYDSVATSTGASDCGMCAVTVLETLRAVVAAADAGQPPRNDIIFLFTDAEEIGVAGALGFMRDHPWAADVGLSLVFEGLGSDSAPLLYIAGPESGAVTGEALAALGDATRYPLAASFLNDFMWAVAGNTGSDLDAFVEGAPGLAFIYLSLETAAAYHASADSIDQLDLRSVQGMGDFALALTRHFAGRPLDELPVAPNLVMFPLWSGVTARYPSTLALPLAIVAAVLLVAAVLIGLRRGWMTGRGILAAFAAWIPAFLTAIVLVSTAWWLVRFLTPHLHNFTAGGWYGAGFYLAAVVALALATAVLWRGLLRRFPAADLLAGGAAWWALLALLTAAALPGLSYMFVWPLLILALGWLLAALRPGQVGLLAVPPVLAAAAAMLLFAPVAWWLWVYVGRAEAMMGLPMAALPVLFIWPALTLAVCVVDTKYEIRDTSSEARASGVSRISNLISAGLIILAIALFAAPGLMRSSPERPWFNSIVYTLDADSGAAHWLAFNDSRMGRGTRRLMDEWTSAFLTGPVEETIFDPWLVTRSDTLYPALRSAAAVVTLPRTAISETAPAGQHVTRLVVERPPEAMLTRLVVRSAAPITGITLDGEALDLGGTNPVEYTFLIIGRDDEVTIHLSGTNDVTVDALDRLVVEVTALAAAAGQSVPLRPEWMAAAAASDTGDGAIITARFD